METFFALLASLPKILAIIQEIFGMIRDQEQRGLGRKEAVAEALEISHQQLTLAAQVEAAATQAHAKDKSDGAFDQDFKEG